MSVLGIFAPITTAIKFNTAHFNVISEAVNLQNVHGTKSTRLNFATLLNERNPSASNNVPKPSGIRAYLRHNISAQGSIQTTGRVLDVSINGKGFLPVRGSDANGNLNDEFYLTRNGSLHLRQIRNVGGVNEHFLVDSDNHYVMGWQANAQGGLENQDFANLGRIQLNPETLNVQFRSTTDLNLNINLPHDTALPPGALYPNTVTIYDSNGNARALNLVFEYTGAENEWELKPEILDDDGNPIATVTPENTAVTFDALGRLPIGSAINLGINFNDGSEANLNVDYSSSTSYGKRYSLTDTSQNGFPNGELQSYNITKTGLIVGNFTNGRSAVIAQIPLVDVANRDILSPTNSNSGPKFSLSEHSMELQTYNLLESYHAQINSGTLELSTIDLATTFTEMIQTQHSFSIANNAFKIINDMVQVAYNLKS